MNMPARRQWQSFCGAVLRKTSAFGLLFMTLIGIAAFANRAAAETDAAARQVARLGRGVNVLGYDPIWSDPAKARFQPRHFRVRIT